MGIHSALNSLTVDLPQELSLLVAGQQIRRIAAELALDCPVGYKVKGYAGQGGRTTTPWIGVFDPDISDRPNIGLYAAYIRHPDSEAVTLTLQQGSDRLREQVGAPEARNLLQQQADWIRSALRLEPDPLMPRSFGPGKRQPLYEAGSVGSVTYTSGTIPTDDTLREHLQSMLQVLSDAATALEIVKGPRWAIIDPLSAQELTKVAPHPTFTPKSSERYRTEIPASSQLKTRLHEKVVNDLAAQEAASGWQVSSEHPIDLTLRRSIAGAEKVHIVEVKQVRRHDIVEAVRGAIGQLFSYRWGRFSTEERRSVGLVAAFSEDIGCDARQLLSDELGIAVLWLNNQQWHGCARATYECLIPVPANSVTDVDAASPS
jgi:hypothetical protein